MKAVVYGRYGSPVGAGTTGRWSITSPWSWSPSSCCNSSASLLRAFNRLTCAFFTIRLAYVTQGHYRQRPVAALICAGHNT
jgi:hypothetical protein